MIAQERSISIIPNQVYPDMVNRSDEGKLYHSQSSTQTSLTAIPTRSSRRDNVCASPSPERRVADSTRIAVYPGVVVVVSRHSQHVLCPGNGSSGRLESRELPPALSIARCILGGPEAGDAAASQHQTLRRIARAMPTTATSR